MGKNYAESSLKRFLKKRVRITLGLVVTFLITGAVAFGGDSTSEDLEYLLLKNTAENHFCSGVCPEGVEFNPEGNILELSEDKLMLDSKIYHNHGDIVIQGGNDKPINLNGKNSEFYNYGNINSSSARIFYIDKLTTTDVNIYNYGKITNSNHYILDSRDFSFSDKKTFFYNYGDLILKANINSTKTELNFFIGEENTIIYNFGSMIGLKNNFSNTDNPNISFLGGENSDYNIINNGYIKVHKISLVPYSEQFEGEKIINNGVILSEKFENRYGLNGIKASENTIKNKGIFIVGEALLDTPNIKNWQTFNNKGVLLQKQDDGTYSLLNPDTLESNATNDVIIAHGVVKDMSGATEINSETIKTDGKEANNLFINNKELKLNLGETVKDKVITAVSQKEGNIILDNNNKDEEENLTLDNTTIIGYFEKDGTLLKVDGDLTLKGNSIINAVAARDEDGNILADAVAVDVAGNLEYTEGENHIFGIIKGGEKSQITVGEEKNLEENQSSTLNEEIITSGELNLEGENWTKGQGNITLEGKDAVVNVDGGNGTLTGYLFGDSENGKTTLDGFIDGTGKLNTRSIRFDLGNLDINGLEDTFVIEGSEGVRVEDALDKIEVSGIFKKEIKDGDVVLSLKSAEEMGIYDPEKQKEYEELVKNFKDTEELYHLVNNGDAGAIRKYLNIVDAVLELLGTAGVKITRDISGAFTNAVIEFDKKADKGQWLTNAKYIGSDMEYEGTQYINGYDSDLNSMLAMAEYGVTENTALGFALGGGDTEVDLKTLNGKSTSFSGENYYAGVYVKHSVNGFDMTGSIGYTISNLDVKNGGSADSEAVTLAGYIKRDIKLTDSIKLEPNLSFTYDYIMQDEADMGEGMTIDDGSSHIFEAGAGMNIVKEFALEKGTLELRTGAKYYLTNIERNEDVTGKFYNADVNLGSPEIDDNRGTANIGFDYEHITGFGLNGKYEMMWSDSGDDSRITAGVSYKF